MPNFEHFIYVVVAAALFFLFCRFVVFRRNITAEDARKVLLTLLAIGALAITLIYSGFQRL